MANDMSEILQAAEIIWDYMLMKHTVVKSDVILGLGSYDVRVAARAAELWLDGYGKYLVFSGHSGKLTKGKWTKPESEIFSDVAISMGVPRENIILESSSTNSGENVRYTHELLSKMNIFPNSIILVQKPYMERRAYATFMKQWPGDVNSMTVTVTSPSISMTQYPNEDVSNIDDVITIMLGDLQRIPVYEKLGFQTPQEIPPDVKAAFENLKNSGRYDGHFV